MTQASDPKKLPQWQNDVAVVLRVAVAPRDYIFTFRMHDNMFTHKMRRQFERVAKSVGLTIVFATSFATLRDSKASRGAPPIIQTERPRELAATLLREYSERGGRT